MLNLMPKSDSILRGRMQGLNDVFDIFDTWIRNYSFAPVCTRDDDLGFQCDALVVGCLVSDSVHALSWVSLKDFPDTWQSKCKYGSTKMTPKPAEPFCSWAIGKALRDARQIKITTLCELKPNTKKGVLVADLNHGINKNLGNLLAEVRDSIEGLDLNDFIG